MILTEDTFGLVVAYGAVLGQCIFSACCFLGNVSLLLVKYLLALSAVVLEYVIIGYNLLGYCVTTVFGFCSAFAWDVLLVICGAFLHVGSFLSEGSAWLWWTSTAEAVRNALWDTAGLCCDFAWKHPLFTARSLSITVAVILLVAYGKDIRNLAVKTKDALLHRIIRMKNQVVLRVATVVFVVTHPLVAIKSGFSRIANTDGPASVGQACEESNLKYGSKDEQVRRLQLEVKTLRQALTKEREARLCVVCADRAREMVTIPCHHFTTCEECCDALMEICPICQKRVRKTIKVFT